MIEILKSLFYGCIIFELTILYLNILFCESNFFDNILNIVYFTASIKIGFLFSKILNLCKFNSYNCMKIFETFSFFKIINLIALFIIAFFLIIFLNFPFLKSYQMYCISNYKNIKILFFTGGILGLEFGIIKFFLNLKFDNFLNFLICIFSVALSYFVYIYEIYSVAKICIYYVTIVLLINLAEMSLRAKK